MDILTWYWLDIKTNQSNKKTPKIIKLKQEKVFVHLSHLIYCSKKRDFIKELLLNYSINKPTDKIQGIWSKNYVMKCLAT